MPNIVLEFKSLEILEKTPSKFGTGAHIIISKNYLGKNIKIIGKLDEENNDFFLSSGSLDPGEIAIKLYKYIKQIYTNL